MRLEDAPLGLALLGRELGRDLQRPVRAAGGVGALWTCPDERFARVLRIDGEDRARAIAVRRDFDAHGRRAALAAAGIAHVGPGDAAYPSGLSDLYDPPFGLFVRGTGAQRLRALAAGPVVAIVGSRRATAAGRALAHELGAGLAGAGAVVVSGLAHGIDTAAHEGALAAGGVTVAVLGCGVDVGYPRRNRELARRIAASGAVVSEYWPGTAAAPWRFPARNRIVAGMSQAVAVVEAGRRSGALITADFALELGRPVLAVPGWPGSAASEGCNGLLRAGAALLETVEDVVAEIPVEGWRATSPSEPSSPTGLAGAVHRALLREPRSVDRLAETLGETPQDVGMALGLLEIEGLVLRGEGQRFLAAPTRHGRRPDP